jgi:hypothetical protein
MVRLEHACLYYTDWFVDLITQMTQITSSY